MEKWQSTIKYNRNFFCSLPKCPNIKTSLASDAPSGLMRYVAYISKRRKKSARAYY